LYKYGLWFLLDCTCFPQPVWHERARALLGEESAERTEELVEQLRHLAEKQSNLHLPPGKEHSHTFLIISHQLFKKFVPFQC
jgi:hypothetical protein